MSYVNFTLDTDADGIALVTWNMPDRSMNLINLTVIEELSAIVEQIAGDAATKGAIVTSGKDSFCAGADLALIERIVKVFAEMAEARGQEAGSSYASPAITASPPTIRGRASGCLRSRSVFFPAPAARRASRA